VPAAAAAVADAASAEAHAPLAVPPPAAVRWPAGHAASPAQPDVAADAAAAAAAPLAALAPSPATDADNALAWDVPRGAQEQ